MEEMVLLAILERRALAETPVHPVRLEHVVRLESGGREEYKAPLEMTDVTEMKELVEAQVQTGGRYHWIQPNPPPG